MSVYKNLSAKFSFHNKSTAKRILKYTNRNKMYITGIFICAFISNLFTVTTPLLVGKTIDNMLGKNVVNFSAIKKMLLILIFIYIISSLFQRIMYILTNIVANRTVAAIRQDAFDKILRLPLKYFDNNAHGDVMSRLTNDMDAVSDGLLQGITQLFSGIITIAGSLIFMLVLSPKITVVVLVMTPLCFLIASYITTNSNKMFRRQQKTIGQLNGYIEEIIGNEKLVKALGYEAPSAEKFKIINNNLYECGQKAQFYSSLTNPATRFVNNLIYIFVGIIGGISALSGNFSVGKIASFLTYANQFSQPINNITSVSAQLQAAFASAERIFSILDEIPEAPEGTDLSVIKNCDGEVCFENISFSYKKEIPLINNLNLKVKRGDNIAIVGPTGAGKTTIVNLLMRFYEINSGSIYVDDYNTRNVTRDSLRSCFGMVLQETWLFNGTVKENIAYGKLWASEEEILSASKASYAHSFIKRLPEGYDTIITEGGGNLSEGQKQLLTIARVMLANPPILILDEATSRIDTRTEINVQKAFKSIMKGRTSFIIAHRLSTIRNADLILVMNKGQIVESGTHKELLEKEGFYSKLYYSQFDHTAAI